MTKLFLLLTTVATAQAQTPITPQYVPIAAGKFIMGSPLDEPGRDLNEIPHKVTLTRDFEIQNTELTQSQWCEVMGTNPSVFSKKENCSDFQTIIQLSPGSTCAVGTALCPSLPVDSVTWYETQEFLNRLNRNRTFDQCVQEKKSGDFCYRLPTEAEWEYATRAGTSTAYFFSAPKTLLDHAWYSTNQTRAVGTLLANPWQLHDMLGNVWEWVSDWYTQYPEHEVTDPTGEEQGFFKMLRGGAWDTDKDKYLRSARRYGAFPNMKMQNAGFRPVRVKIP